MDDKILIPQETSDMLTRYVANKHRNACTDAISNFSALIAGDADELTISALERQAEGMTNFPDSAFVNMCDDDRKFTATFEQIKDAESAPEAMNLMAKAMFEIENPEILSGLGAIIDMLQLAFDQRSTKMFRDAFQNSNEPAVSSLIELLNYLDTILPSIPDGVKIDIRSIFPGLPF